MNKVQRMWLLVLVLALVCPMWTGAEESGDLATKTGFLTKLPDPLPTLEDHPGEDAVVLTDMWLIRRTEVVRCVTMFIGTQQGLGYASVNVPDRKTKVAGRTVTPRGDIIELKGEDWERHKTYQVLHFPGVEPGSVIQYQLKIPIPGSSRSYSYSGRSRGERGPAIADLDEQPPMFCRLGFEVPCLETSVILVDGLSVPASVVPSDGWTIEKNPEKRMTIVKRPFDPQQQIQLFSSKVEDFGAWLIVGPSRTMTWEGKAKGIKNQMPTSTYKGIEKLIRGDITSRPNKEQVKAALIKVKSDEWESPLTLLDRLGKEKINAYLTYFRQDGPLDPQTSQNGLGWFQDVGVTITLADGTPYFLLPDHRPLPYGKLPPKYFMGKAWLPTWGSTGKWLNLKGHTLDPGEELIRFDWRYMEEENPTVSVDWQVMGGRVVEMEHIYQDFPGFRKENLNARWRDRLGRAGLEPFGQKDMEGTTAGRWQFSGLAKPAVEFPRKESQALLRPFRAGAPELLDYVVFSRPGTPLYLYGATTFTEEHLLPEAPDLPKRQALDNKYFSSRIDLKEPSAAGDPWLLTRTIRIKSQRILKEDSAAWLQAMTELTAQSDDLLALTPLARPEEPDEAKEEVEGEEDGEEAEKEGIYLHIKHWIPPSAKKLNKHVRRHGDFERYTYTYEEGGAQKQKRVTTGYRSDSPPTGGVLSVAWSFPAPGNRETFLRQLWGIQFEEDFLPDRVYVGLSKRRSFSTKSKRYKFTQSINMNYGEDGEEAVFRPMIFDIDFKKPWRIEADFFINDSLLLPGLPLVSDYFPLERVELQLDSLGHGWRAAILNDSTLEGGGEEEIRSLQQPLTALPPQPAWLGGALPQLVLDPPAFYWEGKRFDLTSWAGVGSLFTGFMNLEKDHGVDLKPTSAEDLFAQIQDKIRYVSIPMGMKGLVPNPPDSVFRKRRGDCKDVTTLFLDQCSALGVTAYPALVHAGEGETTGYPHPSLKWFNHVVVAVAEEEGGYSFWDPTDDSLLPGELRPDLYGKTFLVLKDTPEFVEAPKGNERENLAHTKLRFSPMEQGLQVKVDEVLAGQLADQVESLLLDMGQESRDLMFAVSTKQFMAGVKNISPVTMTRDQDEFLHLQYDFEIESAETAGPRLLGIPGAWVVSAFSYGRGVLPHLAVVELQTPRSLQVDILIDGAQLESCEGEEGTQCSYFSLRRNISVEEEGEEEGEEGAEADEEEKARRIRNAPDGWFLISEAS